MKFVELFSSRRLFTPGKVVEKFHSVPLRMFWTDALHGCSGQMMMLRVLLLSTSLVMLLFWSPPYWAQNRSESELTVLKQKISLLKQQMEIERKNESDVVRQLSDIEREVSQLNSERHGLEKKIRKIEDEKVLMNEERAALILQNENTNDNLRLLFRSSYMIQRQGSMKLFFNQQDPASVSQSLTFYRYLIESKRRYLQEISNRRDEIASISNSLGKQEKEISGLLSGLAKNQKTLKTKEQSRKKQLARIQARLTNDAQIADIYDKKEEELLRLLGQLGSGKPPKLENSSLSRGNSAVPDPFRHHKGRLNMPLKAPIRYQFGQKRKESGLVWDGVMLAVKEGQQVKSIYTAQVVYADWFRGYGQLVILDHGDGFMSLYGHNQLLYVELGDTIEVGQLIANAGSTGGLPQPGLYFEIRDNGVPVNPLTWCKRQG